MFLEHVNATVADVDLSVAFYQALLGLRVRWRGQTADGNEAAHVGDDRCYLALFQADRSHRPGRAESDYAAVGLNHFGFVVDDLAATKERLVKLGIQPHHEPDYEPGRRLYFLDPDGIEAELVEYAGAEGHGADAPQPSNGRVVSELASVLGVQDRSAVRLGCGG